VFIINVFSLKIHLTICLVVRFCNAGIVTHDRRIDSEMLFPIKMHTYVHTCLAALSYMLCLKL
jgi:hypothetical protein